MLLTGTPLLSKPIELAGGEGGRGEGERRAKANEERRWTGVRGEEPQPQEQRGVDVREEAPSNPLLLPARPTPVKRPPSPVQMGHAASFPPPLHHNASAPHTTYTTPYFSSLPSSPTGGHAALGSAGHLQRLWTEVGGGSVGHWGRWTEQLGIS